VKAQRFWGRITHNTSYLFLAAAVVSVFALIWMGLRLIQQDRALESQQLEEKREAAADRIVAALEQLLANEERKLEMPQTVNISPDTEDFLLVWIDPEGIRVWPENSLLYYPFVLSGQEAPSRLFEAVERAEFQNNDYNRAIALLQTLSESEDPSTRAAAKLRLARNLRKSGRLDDALLTYDELTNHTVYSSVSISGVPIDLVARRARCALLEKLGMPDQLQLEATNLYENLRDRLWLLDRASFLYYIDQAGDWLGQKPESDLESQALTAAVFWLWENNQAVGTIDLSESGRRSLLFHDRPISILWQRSKGSLAAVVAGPGYQESRWYDPLFSKPDFSSVSVSLCDSDGTLIYGQNPQSEAPFTVRPALALGLPWDITLVNASIESELSQFAQRRRFMMLGLALLALLVVAVSYLISRSVSRERAAARLQADFVSAVSHEFRTPLTSMRQFTEMLNEDDSLPPEKRRSFYEAQARATSRLSRLVESLLDFGRMEAGARPYRLERMDAGLLAKTVVREYQEEIGSEVQRIECVVPDEGPIVNGDKEALSQALWNLIDNAMKYSEKDRKVSVEVEAGSQVAIKVRDHGFGIPPDEKKRIMRKFIRGSKSKEHGIKGTGIGLAVVKHIVDSHGGDVLIDSEPGKGSTFTIRLPSGG
jgi:signal transduction histidine kinase